MGQLARDIEAFLISESDHGRFPVLRQVAERFGTSIPTVQKVRSKLVKSGVLPVPPRSHRPKRSGANAQEALEKGGGANAPPPDISLEDVAALTTEEQRARLSWLADNAQREEVRLSAISALARIDSMTGSTQSRGFVLLTKEEQLVHLSLLMKAVGQDGTDKARALAFGA